MSEMSRDNTVTRELTETSLVRSRDFMKSLHSSRFRTWRWSVESFDAGLDWLLKHPHDVRNGIYMSDTPGKEVWRMTMPSRYGGREIVFKSYLQPKTFWDTIEESESLLEARNYVVLESMHVPAAHVLACGETRALGRVTQSFIVTEYLAGTLDGSALMPGGHLWERNDLRMAFSRKTLEIIAKTHQCRFFHNAFHPYKILVSNIEDADAMSVTLIDVANAGFRPRGSNMLAIANDLLTFFVDLRLSSDEIKLLCGSYLEFNPNCGYTPQSLWKMLTSLEVRG